MQDMHSDYEAIERLHQIDMLAFKARDNDTLRRLMSDDAVVLPPGGQMIRGKEALDRSLASMRAAQVPSDVLEYRFDWREVQVVGNYAFEWGYIDGRERDRSTDRETSEVYRVMHMRILQKQPDGAWKVHRTIWNEPGKPTGG